MRKELLTSLVSEKNLTEGEIQNLSIVHNLKLDELWELRKLNNAAYNQREQDKNQQVINRLKEAKQGNAKKFRTFSSNGQEMFILWDEAELGNNMRVIVAGIDLDRFKKNPVLFYNHNYQNIPIGKWTNISVVGSLLVGSPIFDETDTFGRIVKDKVANGFLNACSIGLFVKEQTTEEKDKTNEKKVTTVLKSELFEVSIVDIPANKNAIKIVK